jgi:hypothetical protein
MIPGNAHSGMVSGLPLHTAVVVELVQVAVEAVVVGMHAPQSTGQTARCTAPRFERLVHNAASA